MVAIFSLKKKCVLCGSPKLIKIIEFPLSPIANELSRTKKTERMQEKIPLILGMCEVCKHVQLLILVNSKRLFSNYPYQSNSNQTTNFRLQELATKLNVLYGVGIQNKILEIGSNDGCLLDFFRNLGWRTIGVDPASNVVEIANSRGIQTIPDFFSSALSRKILESFGIPDLIVANNVLAHSNDLNDIFKGIALLMDKKTVLIMEFSYLSDVFTKLLFDTIYHEHTSYHSIYSLSIFLSKFGLTIFDIERISTHGGSVRVHICNSEEKMPSQKVKTILEEEEYIGVNEYESWKTFADRITKLKIEMKLSLDEFPSEENIIVGYGVPAKFSTLFHTLELDEHRFTYVIDDSSMKVGKLAPGTNLSIKSFDEFKDLGGADTVVLFSWNYSTEIVDKLLATKLVRKRIIIPLPDFRIIEI